MIVNAIAHAHKASYYNTTVFTADTLIKLDSVKDKKLLKPAQRIAAKAKRSAKQDTSKKVARLDTTKKKPGGLQSEVKSVADDSTYTDPDKKITYLFGNARVTYEDFSLDADYIRVDQTNHLIFASGRRDPKTRRYTGRPIAKNKDESPLTADSILYNYQTKRAYSYNTSTEQEGNFITGGEAKKLNETEVAYHNILFSTCSLPYPDTHFGIVITKGIGEKNRIISGPAYLEIAGVPLPVAVPFGFFPKPNSRSSGFILPSFGEDARLGFFLRNFGYYKAFSDYLDLTTMASVYSRGSVEIGTTARYLKRYKYQGTLALNFGSHNYGVSGDPFTRDYNIQWTHSQDANAHPGSTFSASVNAATQSYYANNPATTNYNIQQLTQNNLRSSISYSRTWAGTPFNLTTSLSHSQDLSRGTVSLELPTFNFNMSSISPFDNRDRVGEPKWYQRVTVSYTLQGTNKVNDVPESQLFKASTLSKRLQNGFFHQIPIGLNLNVLKYFQFNTSANYSERWYFQSIRKRYARGSIRGNEQLVTDTVPGFTRAGEYALNGGFSTKVYNTLSFKGGSLKAIRHVMTPSLSFNYRPDFGDPVYGYYRQVVSDAIVPYPATSQKYSIYESSVFGGPSSGRFAGVSFSLDNTIEAKMKARSTDTSGADRKVSILQGLSLSTAYNFAIDSFRLSPINLNAHTALFNQKVSVSLNGTLNPYVTEVRDSVSNGTLVKYIRPVDRYTFQNGRFPTLTNLSMSMSFSLNSATNKKNPAPNTLQNMTAGQAQQLAMIDSDPSRYVDFNVPYNVSVNFNFNYNNSYLTKTTSSTVSASGDVNVSPKWKVQYTTNYDFKAAKLGITQFSIYRDLHCWDLSFRWTPFGIYKSFSVDLRVKASILQDLKLTKRKDYYNN
ncbi:putative LPS assembly protein LptD [Mucilaginibacter sp. PAMB04274]|uniref:putative LPS assembly protein LptD n=1 Tax=Mucilaginibacter sp. PAMB04274 TaxID=3138568 RepID=UPI0031F6F858